MTIKREERAFSPAPEAMAAADVSVPLERSLSKMMATKGDAEVDMYADYKLKQREHEFLKIQVRAGTLRLRSPVGRCRIDGRPSSDTRED